MSAPRFRSLDGLRRPIALLMSAAGLVLVLGLGGAAQAAASVAPGPGPLLELPFATTSALDLDALGGRHGVTVAGELETASEPAVCASCTPPLLYHGGPVMGTPAQAGAITVTPIYWTPSGFTFAPDDLDYPTVVNQYITDIAAASGTIKNVFAVNQEYTRASTGAGSGDQIQYSIAKNFAGPGNTPIVDTTPYPASTSTSTTSPGCAPDAAFRTTNPGAVCVTDQAVRTEVAKLVAADAPNQTGLAYIYPVFFPPNVDILSGGELSDQAFCGIHLSFNSTLPNAAGSIVYSEEPYTVDGCFKGQYPQYYSVAAYGQGAMDGDSAVSTLSHEINEAITDPGVNNSSSWYDSSGNEIGDECSGIFGPPLGSTDNSAPANTQASEYNQVINGHDYWTQETFSNTTFAAFKTGQGCVQKAFRPQGSESPTLPTPDLGSGQVMAVPTSLPADGSSTSTVTLTVDKQDGEPVVGDDVDFQADAAAGSEGTCGTLSGGDNSTAGQKPDGDIGGMTDDNGQIAVTYTASTDDVTCEVIASEAQGGTSDFAMIAQGTDAAQAPSMTADGLPPSITAGAAPVTFTTTISNPGSDDIVGALQTIYLAGDDQGTSGLDSSQVELSYSDDTTNGQFVTVPLSGTTVDDGVISGNTLPDTGSTLPAGDATTTTWRISLVAGASASPASVPLIIEADLDAIDPASGQDSNLDYDNATATVVAAPPVVPPTSTTTTGGGTITTTVIEPTQTTVEMVPVSSPAATTPAAVEPATIAKTVPASAAAAKSCIVPKLVGHSPAAARAALKKAKCTSVTILEPAHRATQQLVVRTVSPKAGRKVTAGGTITVALEVKAATPKEVRRG